MGCCESTKVLDMPCHAVSIQTFLGSISTDYLRTLRTETAAAGIPVLGIAANIKLTMCEVVIINSANVLGADQKTFCLSLATYFARRTSELQRTRRSTIRKFPGDMLVQVLVAGCSPELWPHVLALLTCFGIPKECVHANSPGIVVSIVRKMFERLK